jgi:hypothetical protein
MQVNNYHDVEGVLPRFVPQPIYEPDLTPQYVVNDYDWGSYAMATSKYLDAQYELIRTINFATRQATAFIDYNREAAVQGVYENMAIASAQANAAAKAAGDVGRNAMNGIPGPTTFEKVSLVSSLIGTNQTFEDAIFTLGKVDFGDLGTVGKVMTSTSTAVTVGGAVIGAIGGGINISEGKSIRGTFDIGMAFASLVGAYLISNSALIAGCAWAGPVGWTLIGVSVAYSVTCAFVDIIDN